MGPHTSRTHQGVSPRRSATAPIAISVRTERRPVRRPRSGSLCFVVPRRSLGTSQQRAAHLLGCPHCARHDVAHNNRHLADDDSRAAEDAGNGSWDKHGYFAVDSGQRRQAAGKPVSDRTSRAARQDRNHHGLRLGWPQCIPGRGWRPSPPLRLSCAQRLLVDVRPAWARSLGVQAPP